MSDHKSRILVSALELVSGANEKSFGSRYITNGIVEEIVDRSLALTSSLPFSMREHLASRDVSDFIRLSQRGTSMSRKARNTDLLPIGHPLSSRRHSMSRSALRECSARWIASDPGISTDEARALVAAAFNTEPGTVEHDYYTTRLASLPEGSVPLRALVAAFGDGNSSAARSARAKLQRRDRMGRFAWMGGGMSAFISRGNQIFSRTGRLVGQGTNANGNFFDVEYGDGTLARIPASTGESRKGTLAAPGDGYSPVPSKNVTAKDPIINEADIAYIDAPEGFYKDQNYDGPGEKFTDDAYDVIKFDPNDDEAPENLTSRERINFDKPVYVVRRSGSEARDFDYTGQSWAEIQDYIRIDEVALDKEEGRTPSVIAQLNDDQLNEVETNTQENENAEDVAIRLFGDKFGSPAAAPQDSAGSKESAFPNAPKGSYVPDIGTPYVPEGRTDQVSKDYTDDPVELASRSEISDGELLEALRESVSPSDSGAEGTGYGRLPFEAGDEIVPAEAIYEALNNRGINAKDELDKIYGNEEIARLDTKVTSDVQSDPTSLLNHPAIAELPPALGEAPLPDGYARMYHMAPVADLNEILKNGLQVDKANDREGVRGVWISDQPYFDDRTGRAIIELKIPQDLRDRIGAINAIDSDIPPEEFLTVNEEWHDRVRQLVQDKRSMDELVNGEYDAVIDSEDELTRNDPSVVALRYIRDNILNPEPVAKLDGKEYPIVRSEVGTPQSDLPPLLDGLSDEEKENFKETKDYTSYLPENDTFEDAPDNVYVPDPEPFENVEENPDMDPITIANKNSKEDLVDALDESLSLDNDGMGSILEEDSDGEQVKTSVPAEAIRDALQLQGEDTNEIISTLLDEKSVPTPEAEAEAEVEEGRTPSGFSPVNPDGSPNKDLEFTEEYFDHLIDTDPADLSMQELIDLESIINQMEGREKRIASRALMEAQAEIVRREQEGISDKESEYEGARYVVDPEPRVLDDAYVEDLMGMNPEDMTPEQLEDARTAINAMEGRERRIANRLLTRVEEEISRRESEEEQSSDAPDAPDNVDSLLESIVSNEDTNGALSYSITTPSDEVVELSSVQNAETGRFDITVTFSDGESVVIASTNDLEGANTSLTNISTGLASGLVSIDDVRPPDLDPFISEARRLQGEDDIEVEDVDGLKQDVVFPETGRTYTFQVRHQGQGRFGVFIIDDQGNERRIAQRNSPRSALNAINEYSDAVTDGDYNGTDMDEFMSRDPFAVVAQDSAEGNESKIGGFVRRGRNAQRAGADGGDDVAPTISWLDTMRAGRERAFRGGVHARDQLKKLVSLWDSRGHSQNRPEHRIISRDADPNVIGPNGAGEEIYNDLNGNIIRVGDIITHNRVGGLVNPDREAVNIVRARVLKRGKIWRNNKWNAGYLQVEILEADDPQWVGRKDFLYRSAYSEIIEQPDLKEQANREDAAREIPPLEKLKMDMWRESDEEIYKRFVDRFNETNGSYNGQTTRWRDKELETIEAELISRNLTDPGKLALVLNTLTDEAMDNLPDNLGSGEGTHGRIVRALVENERARRLAGESGNPTQLPDLGIDVEAGRERAQRRVERRQQRVEALRPPRVVQESAPEPEPAPASPLNPPPPNEPVIQNLTPVDTRTRFERFVDAETTTTSTAGNVATSSDIVGLEDPRAGQIDPNAANPDAKPKDYTDLGWDDTRAAGAAEAARSRPSLEVLQREIRNYLSITIDGNGSPSDAQDSKDRIQELLIKIYGINSITLGGDKAEVSISNPIVSVGREGQKNVVTISGTFRGKDGLTGAVSRSIKYEDNNISSTMFAYNAFFRLEKDVVGPDGRVRKESAGANVSDAYNRWMENWYVANGIKRVKVSAEGSGTFTGAARWALNNFNWANADEPRWRLEQFRSDLRLVRNDKERERISREIERLQAKLDRSDYGLGNPPTPLQFAMVGWKPGTIKNWFGWNSMVNRSWAGVKDLTPESDSVKEGMGYRDIYQESRKRITNKENLFKPSRKLVDGFSNESTYAKPGMEVLAPYRDEYMDQFPSTGAKPLAALSPPARMALQSWISSNIRGDNNSAKDLGIDIQKELIPLAVKLRDEFRAYDVVPTTVGDNAEVFAKITTQDINYALDNNTKLLIDGQETDFTVSELSTENLEEGVHSTYVLKNTNTGQVFFVKLGSNLQRGDIQNEVYGAQLSRALGIRGSYDIISNDSGDLVIMSSAGDGIRGASSTKSMNVYYGSASRFSLVDLTSVAVLDAVIGNFDRRTPNWRYAVLEGDEVLLNESVIPLPLDHGGSHLPALVSRGETDARDALLENQINSKAIRMLMNYFSDRTPTEVPAEYLLMAAETARLAIERMEEYRPKGEDSATFDMIINRLKSIANMGRDGA